MLTQEAWRIMGTGYHGYKVGWLYRLSLWQNNVFQELIEMEVEYM